VVRCYGSVVGLDPSRCVPYVARNVSPLIERLAVLCERFLCRLELFLLFSLFAAVLLCVWQCWVQWSATHSTMAFAMQLRRGVSAAQRQLSRRVPRITQCAIRCRCGHCASHTGVSRAFASSAASQPATTIAWDPILPPLDLPDEFVTGPDVGVQADATTNDATVDQPLIDDSAEHYVGTDDASADVGLLRIKKPRPDGSYGFKGGRKRAKAYVTLKPTTKAQASDKSPNLFLVNGVPLAEYFTTMEARRAAAAPVVLTSTHSDFTIRAKVAGGGVQGQAEAVRQAVAHGIRFFKPEYRRLLRAAGFVTRDRRVVETKKPGRKKARKLKTKPYR